MRIRSIDHLGVRGNQGAAEVSIKPQALQYSTSLEHEFLLDADAASQGLGQAQHARGTRLLRIGDQSEVPTAALDLSGRGSGRSRSSPTLLRPSDPAIRATLRTSHPRLIAAAARRATGRGSKSTWSLSPSRV